MFCPSCGQERISQETSFCSRCGFLLTGTSELLKSGGLIPQIQTADATKIVSPRTRGIKQGLFIFLLTFLIVPLVAMISIVFGRDRWGVAISAVLLAVGGLLRMAYAVLFESPSPGGQSLEEKVLAGTRGLPNRNPAAEMLTQQTDIPARQYISPQAGQRRDTNDPQPTSVTEGTTKLLEKDELDQ